MLVLCTRNQGSGGGIGGALLHYILNAVKPEGPTRSLSSLHWKIAGTDMRSPKSRGLGLSVGEGDRSPLLPGASWLQQQLPGIAALVGTEKLRIGLLIILRSYSSITIIV